jgi:hypothetical protein
MIIPNSDARRMRIVEFLPDAHEIDHVIIAWDVTDDPRPIILGKMPEKWAYYTDTLGDVDANLEGRWLLPTGERFSEIVSIRRHFGTHVNQALVAPPIKKLPGVREFQRKARAVARVAKRMRY